tara:strand:- start:16616 stop:16861 length:246 start_codon:yes stop_codon:yes gene_type:complete
MLNIFKRIPIITLHIATNFKSNVTSKEGHGQQSVKHNFMCTDTFELIEPFASFTDSRFNFFIRKNTAKIRIIEFDFCASQA